jgi:hypothetical protein
VNRHRARRPDPTVGYVVAISVVLVTIGLIQLVKAIW